MIALDNAALKDARMPTVVVVDDAADMRFLIRMVLEGAPDDWKVVAEAADGEAGLDLAISLAPEFPDVFLLDNRMPRMSGIELAAKVREENPDKTVVLFSSHLDDATVAEATAAGVDLCIGKQDLHDLPGILKELLAPGAAV